MEVTTTVTSLAQLDVTKVASEGAAQSTTSAAQATLSKVGRMVEDMAGGTAGIMAVVERTRWGLPSALVLGGCRSPAWGVSPLHWMDPQDPTSTLFSLDDATESIERGSHDEGILVMMDVLYQARVVLRDVIIPNGRVSA